VPHQRLHAVNGIVHALQHKPIFVFSGDEQASFLNAKPLTQAHWQCRPVIGRNLDSVLPYGMNLPNDNSLVDNDNSAQWQFVPQWPSYSRACIGNRHANRYDSATANVEMR